MRRVYLRPSSPSWRGGRRAGGRTEEQRRQLQHHQAEAGGGCRVQSRPPVERENMSGGASRGCSVTQTRWLCDVIMRRPPQGTTAGISGLYLRARNSLKMKQQVERKHSAGESQRDFIKLQSVAHPSRLRSRAALRRKHFIADNNKLKAKHVKSVLKLVYRSSRPLVRMKAGSNCSKGPCESPAGGKRRRWEELRQLLSGTAKHPMV